MSIYELQVGSQISESERHLRIAMKANDLHSLENLLHDDLMFINQNGQAVTKQMEIEMHGSGRLQIKDILSSQQQVTVMGETTIVSVIQSIKGTNSGLFFQGTFRYLRVWQATETSYKLIAGSCVQMAERY